MNTLEEEELELNPDDAAVEEDDVELETLTNPSVTGTSKAGRAGIQYKQTVTPPKPTSPYQKLADQYKAVCLEPKSRQVEVTIDRLVDEAQRTIPVLARIFTHQLSYIQPFSNLQFSGVFAGTNTRYTVINPPLRLATGLGNIGTINNVNVGTIRNIGAVGTIGNIGGVSGNIRNVNLRNVGGIRGLEAETEQISAVNNIATQQSMIQSYQPRVTMFPVPNTPPKEETLGAIIKAWARGINRLCEEDELVASTPIEYLSTLWDNYVQTSAPAVVNDATLKTLTTRILGEIVKIWIVRCECKTLIATADPAGNYNTEKASGDQACVNLCRKFVPLAPILRTPTISKFTGFKK